MFFIHKNKKKIKNKNGLDLLVYNLIAKFNYC